MPPQPPTSTLFPYTTLFRSLEPAGTALLGTGVRPVQGRGRRAVELHRLPRPERQHAHVRGDAGGVRGDRRRSEEHTSELQSRRDLVCRLLLEKKKESTQVTS